jgi:hypothetical protein
MYLTYRKYLTESSEQDSSVIRKEETSIQVYNQEELEW